MRPPGAGQPLALEPDLLALGETGRDLDLDLLAGRQLHALLHALGGLRQRDGERRRDIAAGRGAEILRLEMDAGAGAATPRGPARRRTHPSGYPRSRRSRARRPAHHARPPAPGEGLEPALAPEAAAGARLSAEALEALEARLAFGVDLAAVERLALVRLSPTIS